MNRFGTFKEFQGCQMISKSYIIQDSEGKQKISCKGISKKQLADPMSKFRQTLNEKEVKSSMYVVFRLNAEASRTSPDTQLTLSGDVTVYAINNIGNRQ